MPEESKIGLIQSANSSVKISQFKKLKLRLILTKKIKEKVAI